MANSRSSALSGASTSSRTNSVTSRSPLSWRLGAPPSRESACTASESATGQPSVRRISSSSRSPSSAGTVARHSAAASLRVIARSAARSSATRFWARRRATGSGSSAREAKAMVMPSGGCVVIPASVSRAARECTVWTSSRMSTIRPPGAPAAASSTARAIARSSSSGSSCRRSSVTQADGRGSRAHHCCSSVVLPYPAGATRTANGAASAPPSAASRRGRRTALRTRGAPASGSGRRGEAVRGGTSRRLVIVRSIHPPRHALKEAGARIDRGARTPARGCAPLIVCLPDPDSQRVEIGSRPRELRIVGPWPRRTGGCASSWPMTATSCARRSAICWTPIRAWS